MPRPLPEGMEQPPEAVVKQDSTMITQARKYRLITPLFGGGVETGKADPITIVRGSEIRGQLRFWWRATRGGQAEHIIHTEQLTNVELLAAMKQREQELWGAASVDSRVRVHIKLMSGDKILKDHPFEIYQKAGDSRNRTRSRYGSTAPAYVAFPLQPTEEELKTLRRTEDTKFVSTNIAFQLEISFPAELRRDVETTLWAWETFGGIGARTRRGFGAIHCVSIDEQPCGDAPPSTPQEYQIWLEEYLADCTGVWPTDVPHLSPSTLFATTVARNSATAAWNDLILKLKNFRGQVDDIPFRKRDLVAIKRIVRNNPEPESIHNFQRATLGLPLIYQNLKGMSTRSVTLQGKHRKRLRFASPVILRPVLCKDGKYIGIAVLLQGSHLPPELTLAGYENAMIDTTGSNRMGVAETFINSIKGAE